MVEKNKVKLPHLLVTGTTQTETYSSPKSAGGSKFKVPNRNRQAHGNSLISQVENLKKKAIAPKEPIVNGIHVTFESDPNFELKLESLENKRAGIELMSVKQDATGKMLAIVFVPEGKLEHFIKVFNSYLHEETNTGIPKHAPLVDSISNISITVLKHLWTDKDILFPDQEEKINWEIWLRVGENRKTTLNLFKEQATAVGIIISDEKIEFPDRTIVLVKGTASQLSKSSALINCIAEIRKAKETADFFTGLSPLEQAEWVNETCSKLSLPDENAPSICILDTGINNGHPLLKPVLNSVDMHTYIPTWSVNDDTGHGTEMAGLALYGDLTETLSSNNPVELSHCLESVKILPKHGENEPHLYGYITAEAIARVEITAPQRQRTICMAVTTTDFRDRGQPSSWSAKLDELSSGANDEQQRLIIVSAGNTELQYRHNFPDSNETDGIHDPGQAWNVLTVGAFTEKCSIDSHTYPDWRVVAEHGDLSPSSCTSMIWQKPWPIKPDIVLEGGNMAIEPNSKTADYVDSLQLLSTHWKPSNKSLISTGDTSAATALASRMAAQLQATYLNFWPETIRALLVHSAEWTNTMKKRFKIKSVAHNNKKINIENILRCCGFGVPNLNEAMWSTQNSLTLIVQESLQPFDKIEGKYKTRDMHLHEIPWPTDILEELGETVVQMKVTLSYFIEPNPAQRGWIRKYSYASHGLRFDVKTPTETLEQFRSRINKLARDEEKGTTSQSDSKRWYLGPRLRELGTVHSDRWNGTAVELAQRRYIAIYPIIGWWRENSKFERWHKQARYTLVVTIKTPDTNVDIYTSVANMVKSAVNIV